MDIVKADSPQQLLLALPHLAGSGIARSVVLVPFTGSRSGMSVRVDLPRGMPAGARAAWAARALEPMAEIGVEAVGIFVVTDAVVGSGPLPHRPLVRALRQRARRVGISVRATLCQATDAWGDYAEPRAARGPIAELEVTEGLPFVAPTPPPSLPTPASTVQRREVAAHIASLEADHAAYLERVEAGTDRAGDVPLLALAAIDAPVLLEAALHEAVLSIDTAAIVIRVLQSPPVRDAATLQWLDGFAAGARAHDEAIAYAADGTMPNAEDGERMLGRGAAPEHDRLERAVGLMERLVSLAPEPSQPSLLTILGTLHWFLGRAGTAERCVLAALAIEPGYGMATLVAQMVQAGWLPEWVERSRRERSASPSASAQRTTA